MMLLLCSVLYCSCCSWCCLRMLFVIACQMAKLLLWFISSDSSVLFLFIETRFNFNVPLGSTVAFTASMFYL